MGSQSNGYSLPFSHCSLLMQPSKPCLIYDVHYLNCFLALPFQALDNSSLRIFDSKGFSSFSKKNRDNAKLKHNEVLWKVCCHFWVGKICKFSQPPGQWTVLNATDSDAINFCIWKSLNRTGQTFLHDIKTHFSPCPWCVKMHWCRGENYGNSLWNLMTELVLVPFPDSFIHIYWVSQIYPNVCTDCESRSFTITYTVKKNSKHFSFEVLAGSGSCVISYTPPQTIRSKFPTNNASLIKLKLFDFCFFEYLSVMHQQSFVPWSVCLCFEAALSLNARFPKQRKLMIACWSWDCGILFGY